jgi:hypothetical protein
MTVYFLKLKNAKFFFGSPFSDSCKQTDIHGEYIRRISYKPSLRTSWKAFLLTQIKFWGDILDRKYHENAMFFYFKRIFQNSRPISH